MSPSIPAALALAGTALMALTIFAPARPNARASPPEPAFGVAVSALPAAAAPQWPQLVEPAAPACDVAVRIDLADALGSLESAWSRAVLRAAYAEETDPAVRSALEAALSSSQSLVT